MLSGIVFAGYASLCFWKYGTLPAPMFFQPNDTFMDFFATTYWSFHEQRYVVWKAVYPLFTFLLGSWFGSAGCAANGAMAMRDCDGWAVWPLFLAYVLGTIISAGIYLQALGPTRLAAWKLWALSFFAFALSLPGLFALERGNYIVFAFLFISAAAYWERDWKGAIALALAINIKQYLIVFWLIALLKRRFRWLAISVLVAVLINWLAVLLVPNTDYAAIANNMIGYVKAPSSYFEKLWYTTSLASWSNTMANSDHVTARLSDLQIIAARLIMTLARWASILTACALFALLSLRSSKLEFSYLAFGFLVCLLVLTDSLGGYAIMLLIPFCSAVVWQPNLRWSTTLLAVLLTPIDLPLWPTYVFSTRVFSSGAVINDSASLTLGSYLRPVLLAFFAAYLLRDLILKQGVERRGIARVLRPSVEIGQSRTPFVHTVGSLDHDSIASN